MPCPELHSRARALRVWLLRPCSCALSPGLCTQESIPYAFRGCFLIYVLCVLGCARKSPYSVHPMGPSSSVCSDSCVPCVLWAAHARPHAPGVLCILLELSAFCHVRSVSRVVQCIQHCSVRTFALHASLLCARAHAQGVPLSELRFKRVLFGGFPCYANGPLQPKWDHIMQVRHRAAQVLPLLML